MHHLTDPLHLALLSPTGTSTPRLITRHLRGPFKLWIRVPIVTYNLLIGQPGLLEILTDTLPCADPPNQALLCMLSSLRRTLPRQDSAQSLSTNPRTQHCNVASCSYPADIRKLKVQSARAFRSSAEKLIVAQISFATSQSPLSQRTFLYRWAKGKGFRATLTASSANISAHQLYLSCPETL